MIKKLLKDTFNYFYSALVHRLDDDDSTSFSSSNERFLKQESALKQAISILENKRTA